MVKSNNKRRTRALYLLVIVSFMGVGFLYYVYYFMHNGYLPSPFLFDKSNTFMDLFNPLYWAYEDGRYKDWGSVYPPLNFLILRLINFLFAGEWSGNPEFMRDNSPLVVAIFCFIYLAIPAFMLRTKHWRVISTVERWPVYLAIILSTPMLFALERGNMAILCPILLTTVLSRVGFARCVAIAILINLKPYFVLLIFYYIVRKNLKEFTICITLSGLFFAIPGLALDNNFFVFLKNIFSFSQEELFSIREMMSLPSSISAFSNLFKNLEGTYFAIDFISKDIISLLVNTIDLYKWLIIITSFGILAIRSTLITDAEIFVLIIVTITNLGVWVGGYTFIYYVALIPSLITMRSNFKYIFLFSILALPLDIIPILSDQSGNQYSYLAGALVDVQWTLGLGSLVRPVVNILLLTSLSYEFMKRKPKSKNNSSASAALLTVGYQLAGERS